MSGVRKLRRRVIGSVNVPRSCGAINGSVTRRHLRPRRAICISISGSAQQKSSRRRAASHFCIFATRAVAAALEISARLSYCRPVLVFLDEGEGRAALSAKRLRSASRSTWRAFDGKWHGYVAACFLASAPSCCSDTQD